jgi:hypothetical protein
MRVAAIRRIVRKDHPRSRYRSPDENRILDSQSESVTSGTCLFCCVLYASLYVLDIFLEIAYQFDRLGHQAAAIAPLVALWIFTTSAAGLWGGWRLTSRGRRGGFAVLLGSFILAALAVYAALTGYLPSEPVTMLQFQAQTAQAAFFKNVVFYFLPLVTLVWLIPFHFVASLHGRHGKRDILAPLDAVYFQLEWLSTGLLLAAVAGVFLTQHLLSNLIPSPYANLFMLLALAKTFVYFGLGMACLTWYSRSLTSIRSDRGSGAETRSADSIPDLT